MSFFLSLFHIPPTFLSNHPLLHRRLPDCQGGPAPPQCGGVQGRLPRSRRLCAWREVRFNRSLQGCQFLKCFACGALVQPAASRRSPFPVTRTTFPRGMMVLIVLEYCDSGSLQDYTRRYRAHMKETKSQPGDQAAGGLSEDAVAYVVREMLSYVHIHHPASTESVVSALLSPLSLSRSRSTAQPSLDHPLFSFHHTEALYTYMPSTSCIATSRVATSSFTTRLRLVDPNVQWAPALALASARTGRRLTSLSRSSPLAQVKIVDFDTALPHAPGRKKTHYHTVGTPYWMAPEVAACAFPDVG